MGKIVKHCSTCEESFSEKFSFCPNCAAELTAFEMKPVGAMAEDLKSEETPDAAPVDDTVDVSADKPTVESDAHAEPVEKKSEAKEEPAPVEEKSAIEEEPELVEEETVFEPVSFEADGEDPAPEGIFEEIETVVAPDPERPAVLDSEELKPDSIYEEVETVVKKEADGDVETIADTKAGEGEEIEPVVTDNGDESDEDKSYLSGSVTTLFGDDGIPEKSADEADYVQDFTKAGGASYQPSEEDDDYHVTVIQESGLKLRNSLLLGASVIVLGVTFVSFVWSVFNHPLLVAAIGDDDILLPPGLLEPIEIEEEPPKEADDDDSGGGGGGGKNEPEPVSRGELPSQSRDPITPPSPTIPKLTNPELKLKQETEGDIKRERVGRTGDPNSLNMGTSSGPGSGGGMGSGTGTGFGSGRGTGEGTGIGSGSGGGRGDGTGDGTGSGRRRTVAPPKPKPVGPTVGIKILSKPRPGYTDSARQNNVQGTVRLRVTFLASGRIGGVSAIKGLPHGLTEKAIAAARQIRFKPAMRNGRAYSVKKTILYNFTIY